MSGFELLFDWNDADTQAMLREKIRRIKNMAPVMADFSEHMVNETIERFEKEVDPRGKAWKKLSLYTQAAKAKSGHTKKLQDAGIMKSSIQGRHDADSVTLVAGSGVEYAAIHNFGGQAGRNHSVEIPQREFIGFNEADIEAFMNSVENWIILEAAR